MTNVSYDELAGAFEAAYDQEEKTRDLQSQIKMIKADISDQFKEFAKDHEMDAKDVKKAFTYWKEVKDQDDPSSSSEDFFSLCVLIDGGITDENEKLKENEK